MSFIDRFTGNLCPEAFKALDQIESDPSDVQAVDALEGSLAQGRCSINERLELHGRLQGLMAQANIFLQPNSSSTPAFSQLHRLWNAPSSNGFTGLQEQIKQDRVVAHDERVYGMGMSAGLTALGGGAVLFNNAISINPLRAVRIFGVGVVLFGLAALAHVIYTDVTFKQF